MIPRAPEARPHLGGSRGERYGALRTLTMLERGEHPGAAASLTKLSYSELEKRFMDLALEMLGPYGQLTDGAPDAFKLDIDTAVGDKGTWAHAFSGRAQAPSTPGRARSRRT